jgi:beta-lactamase regulating signal transducer with metallopeptidase domain
MSNMACLVTSYLVNSIWEVAAIGGAGWLVSRLLKRLGPNAQHLTWVATLALAVAAPMLPLCRSLLALIRLPGGVGGHNSIVSVVTQTSHSTGSNSILLPPTFIQVLSLFYGAAVFYFAARLAWLLRCTITLVREAEPVSLEPDSDELWNRSKRAFSVADARIFTSQRITGPVTAGLIHPALLVPEGFTKICTSQDFLAALAHECAHIERRDFQKNLLYEIASLFIAFHPVAWLVKSQIAQTREMVCDGMVTEKLVDVRTYTQSLLRLVTMIPFTARVHTSNAIGIFDSNILEKRVMTMRTKKQHLSSTVKYGLVISGALLLCSVAGGSGAMTRLIKAQNPKSAVSSDSASSGKRKAHGCTYYDAKTHAFPGTCGTKPGDDKNYYCFRNDDKNISELQSSCAPKPTLAK